jgi:hypothetical protein
MSWLGFEKDALRIVPLGYCRDMARIYSEKFRRMAYWTSRGHRVTISRDSTRPAARFERAAKALPLEGVRLAMYKMTIP